MEKRFLSRRSPLGAPHAKHHRARRDVVELGPVGTFLAKQRREASRTPWPSNASPELRGLAGPSCSPDALSANSGEGPSRCSTALDSLAPLGWPGPSPSPPVSRMGILSGRCSVEGHGGGGSRCDSAAWFLDSEFMPQTPATCGDTPMPEVPCSPSGETPLPELMRGHACMSRSSDGHLSAVQALKPSSPLEVQMQETQGQVRVLKPWEHWGGQEESGRIVDKSAVVSLVRAPAEWPLVWQEWSHCGSNSSVPSSARRGCKHVLQVPQAPVHVCVALCGCRGSFQEATSEAEEASKLVPLLDPTTRDLFQKIDTIGSFPRRSCQQLEAIGSVPRHSDLGGASAAKSARIPGTVGPASERASSAVQPSHVIRPPKVAATKDAQTPRHKAHLKTTQVVVQSARKHLSPVVLQQETVKEPLASVQESGEVTGSCVEAIDAPGRVSLPFSANFEGWAPLVVEDVVAD